MSLELNEMKLGILTEFLHREKNYINACKEIGIEYEVVDIISNDWIENIKKSDCDGYLVMPSCEKEVWKRMYDEKLYFINKIMAKPIYPSYEELFLYENKKNMSYWLSINELPHPKTWVFYNKEEASQFADHYLNYPIMFKTNIGSAAIGVKYIESRRKARKLVNKIFTKYKFFNRGYTKWYKTKYKISYPLMDDKQHNFIIFQEKINVKLEWRMIKIGESYFGHQKLFDGKYHSGSGLVGWVKPTKGLLDFTKRVCEIGSFSSMNLDIFQDTNNQYYINELQSIFGSYDNSQMYIDGVPGRFISYDEDWIFQEGYFSQNGSCNLRVVDFVEKLKKGTDK